MRPVAENPLVRAPATLPAERRAVAEQFAALFFAEALKPLAISLGFYGDVVVGFAAQAAARAERDGLSGLFERALASAER